MLSNTLTLDDEEAVQKELFALREAIWAPPETRIELPSVPSEYPMSVGTKGVLYLHSFIHRPSDLSI
ncbi:hypothetical protein M413DRAFT_439594 [Hebeloma cylindrosporum]|uniref:Uncharacterized protein n=1 Tax=Hebeloma cylindrosporum TaxID=76867 RepID=A0A0C3CUU2_HEBCY|nr:hypothetical protein M413DRAFT_439594 [Hebeloma cylindrosporum h7]